VISSSCRFGTGFGHPDVVVAAHAVPGREAGNAQRDDAPYPVKLDAIQLGFVALPADASKQSTEPRSGRDPQPECRFIQHDGPANHPSAEATMTAHEVAMNSALPSPQPARNPTIRLAPAYRPKVRRGMLMNPDEPR
jgi:hypothetical protein